MKKIPLFVFAVIILLIINSASFAQVVHNATDEINVAPGCELDTIVVWDGTEQDRRYAYFFDEDQNLTLIFVEQWDGTDWVWSSKKLYTYDLSGNLTEEVRQIWNGSWENFSKKERIYDQLNRETNIYGYSWFDGSWNYQTHNEFAYDNDGLLTYHLVQTGSGGSSWTDYQRWDYQYNLQDSVTQRTLTSLPSNEPVVQYSYAYNQLNKRSIEHFENWENGNWVDWWRDTIGYDTDGRVSFINHSLWDSDINDWKLNSSDTYSYNSNDSIVEKAEQTWDETNGEWYYTSRLTTNFNQFNQRVSYIAEFGDSQQPIEYSGLYNYYYNQDNELTAILHEVWENGEWINENRFEFEYDIHGNLDLARKWWWFINGQEWIDDETENYSYTCSNVASVNTSQPKDTPLVFPNPSNGQYQINCSNARTYSVYNMLGMEVVNGKMLTGQTILNLQQLPPGTYTLHLYTDSDILTERLIKQ